jgi:hypothetical protein
MLVRHFLIAAILMMVVATPPSFAVEQEKQPNEEINLKSKNPWFRGFQSPGAFRANGGTSGASANQTTDSRQKPAQRKT